MKPSKYVMRTLMLLLFFGAVAYFGVYAYQAFFGGYETAAVYAYTSQSTLPAQGYLIREETVLQEGGSLEEIVVAEGENVAVGNVVARVYSSESALEQHRELEALQSELERLTYIRNRGTEESDAMRLNQQIVSAMTALRASVGQEDFTQLSSEIDDLEELVFLRDYTYSSSSTLSSRIDEVSDQIVSLQNATQSATSTIYSPAAGIFSAMVDGYESSFSLDELDSLTPARLSEMAQNHSSTSGLELGKVITSFDWYYAAIMSQDVTKHLSTGSTATVNFEGSTGAQEMTVQYISAADEAGKVVVVFHSSRNLSATTQLREQNVDVSYGQYEGLRVPARALRADQETGQLGVYRVSGAQAEWVPVELLYSGRDYYLVQSITEDNQSQLQEARVLRAGDQVLVRGKNIYDGKVIS